MCNEVIRKRKFGILGIFKKASQSSGIDVQVRRNSVRAVITRLDLPLFAIKAVAS